MNVEIILSPATELTPAPISAPNPKAARRTLEFFTAQINNEHTRKAYMNAARRFSLWCGADCYLKVVRQSQLRITLATGLLLRLLLWDTASQFDRLRSPIHPHVSAGIPQPARASSSSG
jgi:hypothetical protein